MTFSEHSPSQGIVAILDLELHLKGFNSLLDVSFFEMPHSLFHIIRFGCLYLIVGVYSVDEFIGLVSERYCVSLPEVGIVVVQSISELPLLLLFII